MKTLFISILIFLFSLAAHALPTAQTDHAKVTLVSEASAIVPGQSFNIAFDIEVEDGWHIYWKNPGDSGLATKVFWDVPAGFAIADIKWPSPEHIELEGLMNYGYEGNVSLLQNIIPPNGLSGEEFTLEGNEVILSAKLDWLVCKQICIPESAEVSITLPVSSKGLPKDVSFKDRFSKIPQELTGSSYFKQNDEFLYLKLPYNSDGDSYFYPDVGGVIEHAAKQEIINADDHTFIKLRKVDNREIDSDIGGVFVSGDASFNIKAQAGQFVLPDNRNNAVADEFGVGSLLVALLFAVLGGLLLNIMPCVFPVLSLKAIAISRKGESELKEVRKQGFAYLFGIVSSFVVLAVVMIALKSTGQTIGWGFHLQSPVFVLGVIILFFVLGLSLIGMFELPILMGNAANEAEQEDSVKGSFVTGILAVLVATPCSVPFMAPAVGYAFAQSPIVTIMIMIALGFGLALPYLLLTWFPALHKRLPKSGAWLGRFKEFMAFPMFATAVWLLWVLAQQISLDDLAIVMFALVGLAFLIWVGKFWSRLMITALLAFTVLTVYTSSTSGDIDSYENLSEPFSFSRLAELREQGKPVFVNATAAWCITCKVNERVALRDPSIAEAFKAAGVTYLVADWTNKDDEITKWLEQYNRSGVPLYVYYPPGGDKEILLPQLLSVSVVLDTVSFVSEE